MQFHHYLISFHPWLNVNNYTAPASEQLSIFCLSVVKWSLLPGGQLVIQHQSLVLDLFPQTTHGTNYLGLISWEILRWIFAWKKVKNNFCKGMKEAELKAEKRKAEVWCSCKQRPSSAGGEPCSQVGMAILDISNWGKGASPSYPCTDQPLGVRCPWGGSITLGERPPSGWGKFLGRNSAVCF